MAGIKDFTSMSYYSNTNTTLRPRKSVFFNKHKNSGISNPDSSDEHSKYREELPGERILKGVAILGTSTLVGTLAYIWFSYLINVL